MLLILVWLLIFFLFKVRNKIVINLSKNQSHAITCQHHDAILQE